VEKQSPTYKRVKAVLDQLAQMISPWR